MTGQRRWVGQQPEMVSLGIAKRIVFAPLQKVPSLQAGGAAQQQGIQKGNT
jgi:hypothetical protein